ncbi:MAG: RNA-directed DNA polymerase [Dehalococcoidia bacterium]|jgi:hypothetical protein
MPGLDQALVEEIDFTLALGRVKTDVLSDFLLAPHYSAVYTYAADDLIDRTKTLLRNGEYHPELPIFVDIPKRSGLSRPGAILLPIDRLVYQLLVDMVSVQAEAQLDRSCVFSHVLLSEDPDFKMFEPADECWQSMQRALKARCQDTGFSHVVKADVASFFERIYRHNLMNLLHSSGCDSRVVNLLEKVTSEFMENDSHGILQGMFPSDFLGNFYLASLDNDLKVKDVPSIRYVDDLYLFYPSLIEAKKGLFALCRILRDEGLNLNESKTDILQTHDLLAEETEIDRLFSRAKKEVREIGAEVELETPYGFQSVWLTAEEGLPEEKVELVAMEELYYKVSDTEVDSDKIEKFCLPYLAKTLNDVAVGRSLEGILLRPYLSKMYCSYLMPFAREDIDVSKRLESIITDDELPYDWSLIWPMAVLIDVDSIENGTVTKALRIMEDSRRLDGLRALAAHLVAKHGNAGQRRLLRHWYDQEPSPYVRAAILFSTRHLPTNERNSCLTAWGSHSITNSLITSAIRNSAGP